uniref:Uncharacterized protein n=1 Tax=Meloidogyne enterolobii TaxID=390850 RepID=A0A6V7WLK6_MELEN|nr:unnamed protein product [Meloidogyne enterolobii]
MLIFIHLILYIFIHSLQSITNNTYGIENSSNNNLKHIESIYDKDEKPLTIKRTKRYPVGDGWGEPLGDGAGGGCSAPTCGRGFCVRGCSCVRCRPKIWYPPRIRKIHWGPRRHRKIRRHWWLRRYVVIEY